MSRTDPDDRLRDWLQGRALEAIEALGELNQDAAMFIVDGDRRLLYWSPGAERLLGFEAAEVVGSPCLEANRCHTCLSGCGVSQRGALDGVPLVLHDASGRAVALRKSARGFFDEAGAFVGGVEVLTPDRTTATPPPATLSAKVVHFHGLITQDAEMIGVIETIRAVSQTDVTVLLRGESGTGKELMARAIHAESGRRGEFVPVNCAAISPSLFESELFGHARGSFTGASRAHRGLFQQADGGTLFLDEVAELPLALQAKLLRVLQDGEVTPVGGAGAVSVDVRLVSATHQPLRALVEAGTFRRDLLYRLRVVPIFLPALRDRREDIELLLWHFIERRNASNRRVIRRIDPSAFAVLYSHDWPGNARELQNVVAHAFATGQGESLAIGALPPELRQARVTPPSSPARARRRFSDHPPAAQRALIRGALEAAGGRPGQAAERLGMSRTTFWRWRKKLDA